MHHRHRLFIGGLVVLVLLAVLIGLCCGATWLSPMEIWSAVWAPSTSANAASQAILWSVRIPRVLLALAVGATLAQCGTVLQALFRNPLAEPSLLGISGGASLGVAIVVVLAPQLPSFLSLPASLLTPLAAMMGGLVAILCVITLARSRGDTDIATLLLAGISINAFAGAGLTLLQTLANDAALRDLTVWLFGNLGQAGWPQLLVGLPILTIVMFWLPREAARLDVMLLGDAEAAHLGIDLERLKRRLLLAVVIATATATALAGIIGFIGLIVPHLLRQVLGARHALLLPCATLFGASLLTLADTAARSLFQPYELPVGVLTAITGVPLFLVLLRQQRVQP